MSSFADDAAKREAARPPLDLRRLDSRNERLEGNSPGIATIGASAGSGEDVPFADKPMVFGGEVPLPTATSRYHLQ